METQKDNIMISKFKGPISKHCRICNQKKLLSKFHLDETTVSSVRYVTPSFYTCDCHYGIVRSISG